MHQDSSGCWTQDKEDRLPQLHFFPLTRERQAQMDGKIQTSTSLQTCSAMAVNTGLSPIVSREHGEESSLKKVEVMDTTRM